MKWAFEGEEIGRGESLAVSNALEVSSFVGEHLQRVNKGEK